MPQKHLESQGHLLVKSEKMRKWLKGQKADNTRMHYLLPTHLTRGGGGVGGGGGGGTGRLL